MNQNGVFLFDSWLLALIELEEIIRFHFPMYQSTDGKVLVIQSINGLLVRGATNASIQQTVNRISSAIPQQGSSTILKILFVITFLHLSEILPKFRH